MVALKSSEHTGWSRHQTFGLRYEWVHVYLTAPDSWLQSSGLGNRQIQSLQIWLRTSGLVDAHSQETWFCEVFRREGADYPVAWEMLWVNAVFNWCTARWYTSYAGKGFWTTKELATMLHGTVPHLAKRTVQDAILELVGLLERTPVGSELGQGRVSLSRPRTVRRDGLLTPSWEAIRHAFRRLFEEEGREWLGLDEDLLWPWVVFGCSREHVMKTALVANDNRLTLEETHVAYIV